VAPRTKTGSSSRTLVQAGGATADAPVGGAQVAPRSRTAEPAGSARLLLGDATGAFLLANEARYRALEAFGIRRQDANLATTMGLLMLANAVYERAHRPSPPKPPTAVANLTIGVGVLRETISGVAGPASQDTPLGSTLIGLAVLGGLARPPLRRGVREIKASSRRLKNAFRGRYGHLVKVGRGS